MKYTKLLRMLTIGVILSLMFFLIPASPALAARNVELDPTEGRIGDRIDVTGDTWPARDPSAVPEPYEPKVNIYFSSQKVTAGKDIDTNVTVYELVKSNVSIDIDGNFVTYFDVPSRLTNGNPDEDVHGGTYYVYFTIVNTSTSETDIKAVAEFTVTAGEVTRFRPDTGVVGTEVDISGQNFGEREYITITYDGNEIAIESGDDRTDSSGNFDCTITIPPSAAGDHTLTVSDETLSEVEETFTVKPEMSVSPTQAAPNKTAEVTGTGFGDRADVEISLNGEVVATKKADRDGNFTVGFTVPDVAEGTYDLVAEDGDGNDAKTTFVVEQGIGMSVSPTTSASSPGHVGQSLTISGFGFEPNSPVTITYATDPQVVGTPNSDAEGAFSYTFKIPKSQAGAHTIAASDGTNSLQVSFYMESQAPPVPQLLLPLMDAKAKSQPEFDWEDVEDDSGVTYDLQVATSEDFTTSSLVLDVMGLTESRYTVTKEEALASRSDKEPYYWRVRGVDGASNETDWTGVGRFSVGFTWPSWIINLWWGLGVIGAIFFGYYLGKRRACYY